MLPISPRWLVTSSMIGPTNSVGVRIMILTYGSASTSEIGRSPADPGVT